MGIYPTKDGKGKLSPDYYLKAVRNLIEESRGRQSIRTRSHPLQYFLLWCCQAGIPLLQGLSMNASVFCLRCGQLLRVDKARAGSVVPCPKCGTELKVPALPSVATAPRVSPVYGLARGFLHFVFFAVLVYLYYEGGIIDRLHSWIQSLCHYLTH